VLFDLQGRRRRVVQVTYLALAILMGGGLVLFGIGSDAPEGLFGIFRDQNAQTGNSQFVERVEQAQARVQRNPRDQEALKALVRGNYQLANEEANPQTGQYSREGRNRLNQASRAWQRYVALKPKPVDPAVATIALQVYGDSGLNRPQQALQTTEIVAEANPNPQIYLEMARYAALAGDERKAERAGDRAVELTPREQRKEVRDLVKQYTAPPTQAPPTQGGGQAPPLPGGQAPPLPGGQAPPGQAPPAQGGAPAQPTPLPQGGGEPAPGENDR